MALPTFHTAAEAARFLRARGCAGLGTDSRRLQPRDGFLAWPGRRHDARGQVGAALAGGAAACLVEAEGVAAFGFDDSDTRIAALPALKVHAGEVAAVFHDDPSARLQVVAATGTNGKTSTAWWTAQALTRLGRRCGLVGTLGVGEPGAMADTGLTTPDAVLLQGALAGFVQQGFAACALEASSIGLVEHRLAGTHIAVAQFTNFTQDHLDHHGSMAAYWAAKRRLFDWPGLRAAVVNVDDPQGAALAVELRSRPDLALWTVSLRGAAARLQAQALQHRAEGLAFELVEGPERHAVRSALFGDYNASNLLVVAAGLRALGLPLADIAAVLPQLQPVPGRLQPVTAGSGNGGSSGGNSDRMAPLVLVDYAHTPDALDQVLQALRPLAAARGGRLWCVFGCGGNRDAAKRPLMGAIAESRADQVVLTSDNPRDEAPGFILSQILAGVAGHDDVAVIEDRAQAIAHAVGQAAAADVVVLAGKGHERYQEGPGGVRRPFADAEVAARALQARPEAAA
ncbi:MAG: UDP-N-acetylmuramoyl-L-alanyl-D-glutamate--2,6-diaminopimelate ligase [Proteobacteria bacterium]|nr:UDP-N-acetylmuramoyl-L-alanyl-D-glutamate--2,6-diaminopimelate ligase [Pseudomonadota bacterium]